jgi:urease accessory protein
VLLVVQIPLTTPDPALPEVALKAERHTVVKRIWRGVAEDGMEFGFELPVPLKHGDTFFQNSTSRYVLHQKSEAVVEISLDVAPSAAAGIGWAVGNLHLELSAESNRLLAPDEPAVRQLLERLKVPFKQTTAIFRPGRFVRGVQSSHELGQSHKH